MRQDDWITGQVPRRAFVDRKPTKQGVAKKKAELSLILGALINRPPAPIASASVNRVREWKAARESAAKVAGNPRSSVTMLELAIKNMQRFAEAKA